MNEKVFRDYMNKFGENVTYELLGTRDVPNYELIRGSGLVNNMIDNSTLTSIRGGVTNLNDSTVQQLLEDKFNINVRSDKFKKDVFKMSISPSSKIPVSLREKLKSVKIIEVTYHDKTKTIIDMKIAHEKVVIDTLITYCTIMFTANVFSTLAFVSTTPLIPFSALGLMCYKGHKLTIATAAAMMETINVVGGKYKGGFIINTVKGLAYPENILFKVAKSYEKINLSLYHFKF